MPKKQKNKTKTLKEYSVDDLETGASVKPGKCRPGSIEQQLDMCETGPLRGDDLLHRHGLAERTNPYPTLSDDPMQSNFQVDMSEENREGSEETGDEHSMGMQGSDQAELQYDSDPSLTDSGMPGELTNKIVQLDPTRRGYRKRAA